MNNSSPDRYIIDTDALVGFYTWQPFKHSRNFWSKLEAAIREGSVVLLDVVADEITYNSPLKTWVGEQRRNGLVTRIIDEVREKAAEINNRYKMINEETGNSQTDTYIVAYASLNNLKVFSREAPKKPGDNFYKIPDVCDELKIGHTRNPGQFLSHIGYREA